MRKSRSIGLIVTSDLIVQTLTMNVLSPLSSVGTEGFGMDAQLAEHLNLAKQHGHIGPARQALTQKVSF